MPTDIKTYARQLRRRQTRGEKALVLLRLLTYRAQRPIHGYIPDFYSPLFKVAVEVQGSVHNTRAVRQRDKTKRKNLRARGIWTIYISNTHALNAWPIVVIEVLTISTLWAGVRVLAWVWKATRV